MRIVAGRFRGLSLVTPKDDRVRPTTDRVRESIFNILMHHNFDTPFRLQGARVLDLFAGTGALGLEALSRGASFVLFVDDHFESRGLIRQNVELAHATGHSKIWRRDATALGEIPPNAGGQFDLVFMDPPYRQHLVGKALTSVIDGGWLSPGGLAVVECETRAFIEAPAELTRCDERTYGDIDVQFWVRAK